MNSSMGGYRGILVLVVVATGLLRFLDAAAVPRGAHTQKGIFLPRIAARKTGRMREMSSTLRKTLSDGGDRYEEEFETANMARFLPGSVRTQSKAVTDASSSEPEQEESDLLETDNTDLDRMYEPEQYSEETPEEPRRNIADDITPAVRALESVSVMAKPHTAVKSNSRQFLGVEGGVVDNANITHISYMVFKLIKKHNIKSLIDMPCRNTLNWFPELLHRIDFEISGFKYYCVDSEKHSQDDIRPLYGEGNVEFIHIRPEDSNQLPKVDMLFSWDGPQQWGVRRTWNFFNGIREIRPSWLLLTNNPSSSNTNERRGHLNFRKPPFHVSLYLVSLALAALSR